MTRLLNAWQFEEIAARAVRIESRTNPLFSFEKMALRDAVRTNEGAKQFAEGLHAFLHGKEGMESRFEAWGHTMVDRCSSTHLSHPTQRTVVLSTSSYSCRIFS
jgi:hypothetical protein